MVEIKTEENLVSLLLSAVYDGDFKVQAIAMNGVSN